MRRPPWIRYLVCPAAAAGLVVQSTNQPLEGISLPGGKGTRGAVASESDLCSQIGVQLMKNGGNAADAMVGTNLCVGVVGMYHSGIGGGGFMLIRDEYGNYESVDYRETAPAAAFEDMYKDNTDASIYGGLAAGVPGELKGLEYLHEKYGLLPWRAVVQPAADLARNGFNVTEDLVRYMASAVRSGQNFLVDDPVWAEDFAPHGTLLQRGDLITRKRYADTLETIGRHGVGVFYEGELAQSMIDLIQATNGTMTLEDLREYNVSVKEPLSVDYRDYRLFTTGAPSSGAVALSILKTMEQYPQREEEEKDVGLATHRFDEAMRFAYGARQNLGDPDFIRSVEQFEGVMLSDERARQTRARIRDDATQPVEAYDPDGAYVPESAGTSHMVTADGSGLTVTSTTTVNLLFGARIMTPRTGIILNNEMNDFSIPGVRNAFGFEPSPNNFVAPRKRPLSSITPVIAEHRRNRSVAFATGAAGGSRIISATAQVAWHLLEHHAPDMARALAHPRLHDQLMPNVANFEYAFDNRTVAAMRARGHNVSRVAPGGSSAQGIRRLWDGVFEAASEPRQKNSAGMTV